MRHPRKKKDRRDRLVMRVREQRAASARFRVRVPMEIQHADPVMARDILLDALRAFPGFESRVSAGDSSIAATLEVEAGSAGEAKTKALYWIKRAAELSGQLTFSGRGIGQVDVEAL